MTLTYATLTEGKFPEQIEDFNAYLAGRELPSLARKRKEREDRGREFVANAQTYGGEVG